MKRTTLLASLFAATLACSIAPGAALAKPQMTDVILGQTAEARDIDPAELPDITATHAIIVDPDGATYFERGADEPIKIASITKVMTALVALEHAEPTDVLTVDHAAATVGESAVGLREGDTLTMDEALTGLMVMSGNDAASAIATHVGRIIDPQSQNPYGTFITAMNDRARELGCTDTLFENPHGLDFGAWEGDLHATPRDVMRIYAEAMKLDAFRDYDNSNRTSMTVTSKDGKKRTLALTVRNKIRGKHGNIGGKTGSTYEAGACFVGGFSRDGREIYVAVYGCEDDATRFAETVRLADWYYQHLASLPFANPAPDHTGAPAIARASCGDWTDVTVRVGLAEPETAATTFSLAGPIEQQLDLEELRGDIKQGEPAGTIVYRQGDEVIGEAELVTLESREAPTPFEWVMVQFDRIVRFFEGKPATAPTEIVNVAPDPLACDAWGAEK